MVKKLIIDCDPGIDDSMAILAAFNSPKEVEVIGLTTIFGNVQTATATGNALVLRELAGRPQVPVAQGAATPLSGVAKARIADFVHGSDGFGNTNHPAAAGKAEEATAAQFIVDAVRAHPSEVTVLALGPLTNLALALQLDSTLAGNLAELVILGGAFFVNGNVNPAAEANIFGDPDAAEYVFQQPVRMRVVGLDVTHTCTFTGGQLAAMRSRGRFGSFLASITRFYLDYHRESYGMDAVYVHDPTALAAVLDPSLFTWQQGAVCVVTEGVARGLTVMDAGTKSWNGPNAWMTRPSVAVAVGVQAQALTSLILDRMTIS
ncbi:hypothetical protein WJX72_009484 [[Myrmecia] bisecta]|uniref:Inosine/uridine-preferring nucleoside hydrolase domain-containing protein n=1 Tax=[Myrmecia] bisecta TaxID=41462 RepID=A0AAW1Q4J6_9CHLO